MADPAVYNYTDASWVSALQWTGSNLADFTAAGFAASELAVSEDGQTLLVYANIAGYGPLQWMPIPIDYWMVTCELYGPLPTPLLALRYQQLAPVMDPTAFAATFSLR